jgi:hypothetical protein
MRTYGFTFHVRGRMDETVRIEDACGVGEQALFYAEAIFVILTLLDPQRMKGIDSESLCVTFETLGEIGLSLTSVALSCLDRIERERERLTPTTPEKGGTQ